MKKFSSLIIALAACIAGFAQNARTVSGIVTESDGTPVVAAMVIEKGTMNGASTDIDGKYSIRVSDKDIVLEISCIGFETLEVPVSGTQAIANATLKQDNMLIDDAIVIGYGVQNRRDVTTSIVSMKAEDMTNKTNADFREMMAAKMPGVQVLQLGGRPAGNVSVRIRGIQSATSGNDPLYVIDGIPTESSVFSQLDASDIESIEVLKDASAAAIYGSRGSCGVILITTKRGNSEQPRITYDGYYGIAQVSKKIDLLDAWEFATMFKEKDFWIAFGNTLIISIVKLLLNTFVAVLISIFLNEMTSLICKKFIQTVIYLPHFMSYAVVAAIFTLFLSTSSTGMINETLKSWGWIDKSIDFLHEPLMWRPVFYIINLWKETGWGTVIFFATLSGINPELYEAAEIDGATRLQKIRYITLPALSNTIIIVLILNIAKVLNIFEPVFVLYNSRVLNVAQVISTYVYDKTFLTMLPDYGYSTAVGLFKSVVGMILMLASNFASKKVRGRGII